MTTIDINGARTNFSRLVDEAAAGGEIVIAKAGKPVARLVSYDRVPAKKRRLGTLAGRFQIPSDFDDPLPDALLDAFEGR